MALLEVRNLSVGIDGCRHGWSHGDSRGAMHCFAAVKGIDVTINAGEIIGLAGESGCGKSLSSLAITRLLPPAVNITGGEIQYVTNQGQSINLCSADETTLCRIRGKEIGMIFQEPKQSLNPLMRIGSQIAETLELHGTDTKTARNAALDMLIKLQFPRPEQILNTRPHQLSGGMCQRVMIAIAAICRPRLLIADEPVTALDTANQENIISLLRHINREFGTAILFISHDLSVMRHLCGRLMVMYAGKIIEEGPAEALFTTPRHPYTAALIGAEPSGKNRGRPLAHIPGKAPAIEDQVPGCPFAPRCPQEEPRCNNHFPSAAAAGAGHTVYCCNTGAVNV